MVQLWISLGSYTGGYPGHRRVLKLLGLANMDQNTVPYPGCSNAANADPMAEFWCFLALSRMGHYVLRRIFEADGPKHAYILRIYGLCSSYVNYLVFMWVLCRLVVLLRKYTKPTLLT